MANFDAVTTSGAVLGRVLVNLRTERGMKQADLAAAVGLGPSTWSRIEKGESGLSIEQLKLAAKVLSITPSQFLEMVDAVEQELIKQGIRIEPTKTSAKTLGDELMDAAAARMGVVGATAPAAMLPVVGYGLGFIIGNVMARLFKDKDKNEDQLG